MVKRVDTLRILLFVALLASAFAAMPVKADRSEPQHGMGVLLSVPGRDYPVLDVPVFTQPLPSVVDLSASLPPVRDQGVEPTCTLWAVGYYYKTLQEQRERNWGVGSADHQFSPSFLYSLSAGCQTLQPVAIAAAMEVIKARGAATLATFPVLSFSQCRTPTAAELQAALPFQALSYGNLFMFQGNADIARLKAHLASGDAFVLSIPVYDSFYFYHGAVPVIGMPAANERLWGYHAVLIVGYDDNLAAFKLVNSWGTRWGMAGFAYLSYDFVRTKAWEAWAMIDAVSTTPVLPTATPVATPQPTATATPLVTPISTPTVVPTATPIVTSQPTATPTSTPTAVPTATASPSPQVGPVTTLVLQQGLKGYRGALDSYIDSKQPAANYDTSRVLKVSDDGSVATLLHFDLGAIPVRAEIVEATLEIYVDTYAQSLSLAAFEIVRPWVNTEVDWLKARQGNAWGIAGCNDTATDRASTPISTQFVTPGKMWRAIDVTSAVRHWVADPTSNSGLVLRGQGGTKGVYGFVSSEHSSASNRPRLTIKYRQ